MKKVAFLVGVGAISPSVEHPIPADISTVRGGMTVSRLRFATETNDTQVGIQFSTGDNDLSLLFDPATGDLSFSSESSKLLTFNHNGTTTVTSPRFVSSDTLCLNGEFLVGGVRQWRVVHFQDFSSFDSSGWDNENRDLVTECAGIFMLGGYGKFAKGEIAKQLTDLPPHTQLRVRATFHFIDAWVGETGFMRLNIGKDGSLVHVWTERHSQDLEHDSVNVCGGPVGEGKFAVPVDVAVAHTADSVIVAFGSTIQEDDPLDESWGVSGFEVLVR